MIRTIPTINTHRLSLSAMRPEDFDRIAALWAMPELARRPDGAGLSRGRAWEWFLRNAGHWQMTGFGQWAVVESRRRRIVGISGFFYGSDSLGDDFDPYPEARCLIDPAEQGAGLGREAAQAAHDWFDRVIPGPLVARLSPENAAGRALAERLGYVVLRQLAPAAGGAGQPGEAGAPGGGVILLRRNRPPQEAGHLI